LPSFSDRQHPPELLPVVKTLRAAAAGPFSAVRQADFLV